MHDALPLSPTCRLDALREVLFVALQALAVLISTLVLAPDPPLELQLKPILFFLVHLLILRLKGHQILLANFDRLRQGV